MSVPPFTAFCAKVVEEAIRKTAVSIKTMLIFFIMITLLPFLPDY
jgi:hypothetical protein